MEARQRQQYAPNAETFAHWSRVARAVARLTGKRREQDGGGGGFQGPRTHGNMDERQRGAILAEREQRPYLCSPARPTPRNGVNPGSNVCAIGPFLIG